MPEKSTVDAAKEDLRKDKSPSTAAGEFVREEIDHIREGKHGARSPQQAIAIGLSKARRAGIPLKPPSSGRTSAETRRKAERDYEKGQIAPETREEGSTSARQIAYGRHEKRAEVERIPRGSSSHAMAAAHMQQRA